MIRVGCINIDVSHPSAFAEHFAKDNRARYVAVYNDGFRSDQEVQAFIEKYDLIKRCDTLDELAKMTDIGFIHSCNWDKHLDYVEPFSSRGKPVFIDKPLVGNISDCKRLKKMVDDGAVILGSSLNRYSEELINFLNIPIEERGEIIHVFGTCGTDDFNYGIHIIEVFAGLLGRGAVSCKFAGRSTAGEKPCDTYLIQYENGINAVCALYHARNPRFTVTVMTTKATFHIKIPPTYIMLDHICEYMETGKSPLADIDAQIECIKILLAGRISRLSGGETVKLTEIPDDDTGFDGYAFEKEYAEKAMAIK